MPLTTLTDHTCRACGEPVCCTDEAVGGDIWFCDCEEVYDQDLSAGLCEIPPHWGMAPGQQVAG